MPSFDIVSQIDMQEVENAINQARKVRRADRTGGACLPDSPTCVSAAP